MQDGDHRGQLQPDIGNTMGRTISSDATFFVKFIFPIIFPVIWIVMFAVVTDEFRLGSPRDLSAAGRAPIPPQARLIFLTAWLFGLTVLMWYALKLKRVRMRADGLLVSNYRAEVLVPFAAITGVTQSRWTNARLITVRLRYESEVGRSFTFMPPRRMRLLFWGEDEIVGELRERAGLAHPAQRSAR